MSQRIDPDEFVRLWQQAASLEALSATTGLGPNRLRQRAVYFRQKGVQLKPLDRKGGRSHDWDELAKLARSLEAPA